MMESITLPKFLRIVDEHVSAMTHEDLAMFIHEMARTLPEAKREKFILALDKIDGSKGWEKPDSSEERDTVISGVMDIIPKLEKIKAGERRLDSRINEEWDDWYSSDQEEFLFTDPDKLTKDIQKAIKLLHKCVDHEISDQGSRLCEVLCDLKVLSDGDYDDCCDESDMSIEDLYDHELLQGSFEDFAKDSLYITYIGSRPEDRTERMYGLFAGFKANICLQDILQMGNHELPEFEEFLKLWIEYVGKHSGYPALRLLEEAQLMLQDEDTLVDNARKLVDQHPELYLQILRAGKMDDSRMLSVGLEALDRIPENLKVRSEIALIASCYAGRSGMTELRDRCWLEALKSGTTAINYMRIKFLSSDAAKYEEEIASILDRGLAEIKGSNSLYFFKSEFEKENKIYLKDLCVMLFFEKRFSDMEEIGMPSGKSPGWTMAFMEEGIAFILLLLSFGDSYSSGMDKMIMMAMETCGFSKSAFYQGIEYKDKKTDRECFLEIIDQWRKTVSMSEEEELSWIEKLEMWVKSITLGIMQDNRRSHYGECAALIAAIGEVKEDLFEIGAKDTIMMHYKELYPRRKSFHEELRRYGMGKKNNFYRF